MPFAQDVVRQLIDDGPVVKVVTSSHYSTVPPRWRGCFSIIHFYAGKM